jgi:drug/metabolite transporter (DMT)-like permease
MGTLPVLLFAALPIARTNFARVPFVAWLCLAAVIVFASVLAYILNGWALARTHASHVAMFVALQPAVAASLAIAWLGEIPGLKTVFSAALILAGLFVSRARLPSRNP